MADIYIPQPDMGLNCQKPTTLLDPREAARGSQNTVYEYGVLRTPFGFAKLDLTTGLNSGRLSALQNST
jgi:hypothetical protein